MKKSFLAAAVAIGTLIGAGQAQAEQFVNVLSGGTSGVYYPLGVALSKIYADNIKDVRTSVQSTKASVENLNLLNSGRGEVAFTLGDSLSSAWSGDAEAGFKAKLENLRGIAGIYPNYIQIVARADSGIKTLADLKGKRVSVGPAKSGTELNAREILAAGKLSYSDFGKTEYLAFGESVELMKNRQLDAAIISAGLGVSAIRDLSATTAISVVEIPASIAAAIVNPVYISTKIPAGTYDGVTADVNTVAIKNFLVTRADLSADLVYEMTRLMFEKQGDLVSAHAAAKELSLADAVKGMPLPLHPGAEKYLKEKGISMTR